MFGTFVFLTIGMVCLFAFFLGFGAFAEIMVNGSGFRCIFRDKAREAAVFLSSISVISVCLCYVAITDILKDYAGYKLFLPDGKSVQSVLPDWARCELEWSVVMWAVIIIALSQLAMLVIMVNRGETAKRVVPASPRWKEDIGFPQ